MLRIIENLTEEEKQREKSERINSLELPHIFACSDILALTQNILRFLFQPYAKVAILGELDDVVEFLLCQREDTNGRCLDVAQTTSLKGINRGGTGQVEHADLVETCAGTHHKTILVHIQLLPKLLNRLLRRCMLDAPERLLQILQTDLSLGIRVDDIQAGSDLLVVLLQLGVDLLDHGSDAFGYGNGLGVGVVGSFLGFLRVRMSQRSLGYQGKGRAIMCDLYDGDTVAESQEKLRTRQLTASDSKLSSNNDCNSCLSLTILDLAVKIFSASANSPNCSLVILASSSSAVACASATTGGAGSPVVPGATVATAGAPLASACARACAFALALASLADSSASRLAASSASRASFSS